MLVWTNLGAWRSYCDRPSETQRRRQYAHSERRSEHGTVPRARHGPVGPVCSVGVPDHNQKNAGSLECAEMLYRFQ